MMIVVWPSTRQYTSALCDASRLPRSTTVTLSLPGLTVVAGTSSARAAWRAAPGRGAATCVPFWASKPTPEAVAPRTSRTEADFQPSGDGHGTQNSLGK